MLTKLMINYIIKLIKKDKEETNKEFKKDTIMRLKKLK